MEIVPKLEGVKQNYVQIERGARRRRGDNTPMVHVVIKNSEKYEVARMHMKEKGKKGKKAKLKNFARKMLAEEKAHY